MPQNRICGICTLLLDLLTKHVYFSYYPVSVHYYIHLLLLFLCLEIIPRREGRGRVHFLGTDSVSYVLPRFLSKILQTWERFFYIAWDVFSQNLFLIFIKHFLHTNINSFRSNILQTVIISKQYTLKFYLQFCYQFDL